MAKNDIGGFFVSLGLNPDKNSFETGNKLIDGVANSFNKLIGTARNAAVVLASTALASGAMASQELHTSQIIGTTTEKLNLWRAAAKIAGADANGLVGAISKLGNVMNHLTIDGSGLEAYSEQLGKLQIGFNELEGMDPADAMKTIIERAQAQLDGTDETKLRITTIVGDILGDAGQQLFVDLNRQGVSIGNFLAGVGRTQFETEQDKKNAAGFITEVRFAKEELTSLTKLFGDSLAKEFTPLMQEVNDWLQDHGKEIADKLREIAKGVGKLVGHFIDIVEDITNNETVKEIGSALKENVVGSYEGAKDMVVGIATGNTEKIVEGYQKMADAAGAPFEAMADAATKGNEAIQSYKEETGQSSTAAAVNGGARSVPVYKWFVHAADWTMNKIGLQSDEEYAANTAVVKSSSKKKEKNKVKDGILRPDGTVTQVAPDDWVLAVRNIGDLARAFIPQSMTQVQAPSQYSIVQNFTINGGNDIPQVLKAQAYRGTQEGLMAVLEQSSRRLEMMSGTR